jgi:glycosyltransferase involved in cell wall biosynthesis
MPAHPQISVILTTYNRLRLLPRAIASVLAQDDVDFELIIVDDCSTDGTLSYLRTLTDPRIRVLATARNSGVASARNTGLNEARAEIFALLDDDDIYLPHRLSAPLRVFARHPDVVCTLSSAVKVDLKRTQAALVPDLKLAPAVFEWALICDLIGVEGTSISARRSTATQIGGFNTRVSWLDDREFMIRMSCAGAGHLIAEPLWQKYWSIGGLSNQWAKAGATLIDYVAQRPEIATRYRKLGSYLATKVLVSDLRHGLFRAVWHDWRAFKAAKVIDGNLVRMWRDHREVADYRRRMKDSESLATLAAPPDNWN